MDNKKIAIISALVVALAGCTSTPVRLTQTSAEDLAEYDYKKLPEMTTGAASFALFYLIPIKAGSCELRARNDMLKRSGADDIINPSISSSYVWTPAGAIHRIKITATPIIINKKKKRS